MATQSKDKGAAFAGTPRPGGMAAAEAGMLAFMVGCEGGVLS